MPALILNSPFTPLSHSGGIGSGETPDSSNAPAVGRVGVGPDSPAGVPAGVPEVDEAGDLPIWDMRFCSQPRAEVRATRFAGEPSGGSSAEYSSPRGPREPRE